MKYLQLLIIFSITTSVYANYNQSERDLLKQLKNLALEDLVEVEMFNPKAGLAARKIQNLTNTAAALFVITQEDIRRAGITNLAEALRMVPGMQVARVYPHIWAISSRGLNKEYASKLLVMIDGRTVYTPLRSSVNWDSQDVLMEDVERIEVIRGPGASLWGANAVNGIINIITKSAQTTRGNLITTHIGNGEEQASIGVRHGGQFSDDAYYRIYGKFYDHEAFPDANGDSQNNDWQMKRTGLHVDWAVSEYDSVNFQASAYDSTINKQDVNKKNPAVLYRQYDIKGINLLANWQHDLTNGDIALKTYMTFTDRQEININEKRDIYDIDFQHRLQISDNHEFIWGLGFRYTTDEIESSSSLLSYSIIYTPSQRKDNLFSGFAQSEFKFLKNIRFTVGSKIEHNNYTGFEIQPTARLLWNFDDRNIFWAAVSRAIRTPSRANEDIRIEIVTPTALIIGDGNKDLKSEVLIAYEFGYRFKPTSKFLLDASIFYNDYDYLGTNELVSFKPFPSPVTTITQANTLMDGEVYGLELATHWQVNKIWRLVGTYSYLDTQLHRDPNSGDKKAELLENNSPHHQVSLRSLFDLSAKFELDSALYYVDNVSNHHISSYIRFDTRLGWQLRPNINISLGARNLFDNQHLEFSTNKRSTPNNEVPRSFYAQLKYYF